MLPELELEACDPVVPEPELDACDPVLEPVVTCDPLVPEPDVEPATWMPVVPPELDPWDPDVEPLVAADVFGTHWPLLLQPVLAAWQSPSVEHSITHALLLQRPSAQSES